MALKDKYISVSQAAKELGVTRQTIHRWIAKKYVPAEKVGRVVLIKKEDLHKYHKLRLSEAAADSVLAMYKSAVENILRETGHLKEGERIEIAGPGDEGYIALTPKQKAEVNKRLKPILADFLKDLYQRIQMVEGEKPKG